MPQDSPSREPSGGRDGGAEGGESRDNSPSPAPQAGCPYLIEAKALAEKLVRYTAELIEKLPAFPGEFRDLFAVIEGSIREHVEGGRPPEQATSLIRMLDIHLERLQSGIQTRWNNGTGARCDNIRSFHRYLYAALEVFRSLRDSSDQVRQQTLLGFYRALLGFAETMRDSNPERFLDAYEKRKLRKLADPGRDDSAYMTPVPTLNSDQANRNGRVPVDLEGSTQSVHGRSSSIHDEHTIVVENAGLQAMDEKEIPTIPGHEIYSLLGRGGMGVVYEGVQAFLDRRVAVKVLTMPSGSRRTDIVDRFRREAKLLAGMNHPNIVACYQAGLTETDDPYIVMELISGPSLRDLVAGAGPLEEQQALEVTHQIAQALRYALENDIIHRDVKAQNILLQPLDIEPEPGVLPYRPKLVDLGLARYQVAVPGDMQLTVEGRLVGTPSVMAPEQFEHPDDVDHRCDIYALGCVLYYMLTGEGAFSHGSVGEVMRAKFGDKAPEPRAVRRDVSDGVNRLVRAMLARSPNRRPQDYKTLLARLDALLARNSRPRTGGGTISRIIGRIVPNNLM